MNNPDIKGDPACSKYRILIADDHLITLKLVSRQLEIMGFRKIETASNGVEAEEMLENGDFDVVIIDWNMPGKDGLAVIRDNSGLEKFRNTAFLMLSAQAQSHSIDEAINAGAKAYLVKPVSQSELRETMNNVLKIELHEKKAVIDTSIFESAVPANEARILAAEGHEVNRIFLRKLFQTLGIGSYRIADNGSDAVEEAHNSNYDLILMDCLMPGMNGYDAAAAIRNLPDHFQSAVPIIAMTDGVTARDEERCLATGMNACIGKPFDIEVFKHKLSPWINFSVGADSPVRDAGSEDPSCPANLTLLMASSMGDQAYIKEMIGLFVVTAAQQIDDLRGFCGDDKSREWHDISHGLKGTASAVGAVVLGDLCARAQAMEKKGRSEKSDLLQSIGQEYLRIKNYFIKKGLYGEP